jgi:2-polyprenyl-3-methyl-5-hydroxy-6-metoxy-1,4-benzoquinol methylase
MSEIELPQGLVTIAHYKSLLNSELLRDMERFSNDFVERHQDVLRKYSRKWVADPLHQWSRQWEYPFVYSQIRGYAASRKSEPLRVLDAGSGITFFPYYLKKMVTGSDVTCCDVDSELSEMFERINERNGGKVDFVVRDIKSTGLESGSIDIIYCISVLEHTTACGEIVEEFVRLLKGGGQLVVTFDISLDGRADISVERLPDLVAALQARLVPTDGGSMQVLADEEKLFGADIVTTTFFADDRRLLPWRYPFVTMILDCFRRRQLPHFGLKKTTFACCTFVKQQ